MRAILFTAACVIVSVFLIAMMAKGPTLGLFAPARSSIVIG